MLPPFDAFTAGIYKEQIDRKKLNNIYHGKAAEEVKPQPSTPLEKKNLLKVHDIMEKRQVMASKEHMDIIKEYNTTSVDKMMTEMKESTKSLEQIDPLDHFYESKEKQERESEERANRLRNRKTMKYSSNFSRPFNLIGKRTKVMSDMSWNLKS